jgi:hypothetical protein
VLRFDDSLGRPSEPRAVEQEHRAIGVDHRFGKPDRRSVPDEREPRAVGSRDRAGNRETARSIEDACPKRAFSGGRSGPSLRVRIGETSRLRGPCEGPALSPGDRRRSAFRGFGRPKHEGTHRKGNLAVRSGGGPARRSGNRATGRAHDLLGQPGNRVAESVNTTNSTGAASGRRERDATNAARGQPCEASVDATSFICGAPQARGRREDKLTAWATTR